MSTPSGGNLYEYPNGVLRNKFGITDAMQLQQIESTTVYLRLTEINNQPLPGQFDLDHLRAIHRYLFQDIYDWAGEIRQVDISKGNSLFAHFGYLETNAQTLFGGLAQEQHLRSLAMPQFAQRAAFYLGEVNALHPFREGNGRTQRVFFTELARQAGYRLNWAAITAQQMLDASRLSLMHGNNSGLEQILGAVIAPLQQP